MRIVVDRRITASVFRSKGRIFPSGEHQGFLPVAHFNLLQRTAISPPMDLIFLEMSASELDEFVSCARVFLSIPR